MKVALNRVPNTSHHMLALINKINQLKGDYVDSIRQLSPEDQAQYVHNMKRWLTGWPDEEMQGRLEMRNHVDSNLLSNLPGEERDRALLMKQTPDNLFNTLAMIEHDDQMSQYLVDAIQKDYTRPEIMSILEEVYPGLGDKWKADHTPNDVGNMLRRAIMHDHFSKLQNQLDSEGMPARLYRGVPFSSKEHGKDWWDMVQAEGLKTNDASRLPLFLTSEPSIAASYGRSEKFSREQGRRLGEYSPPTNFGTRIIQILTAGLPDSLRVDTSSTLGEIAYGPQFAYGDDIPNDMVEDPTTGLLRPRIGLVHYNSDGRLKDIIKPRKHLLDVPRRF